MTKFWNILITLKGHVLPIALGPTAEFIKCCSSNQEGGLTWWAPFVHLLFHCGLFWIKPISPRLHDQLIIHHGPLSIFLMGNQFGCDYNLRRENQEPLRATQVFGTCPFPVNGCHVRFLGNCSFIARRRKPSAVGDWAGILPSLPTEA